MSLDATIRAVVAQAAAVVADLLVDVVHEAYTGHDGDGKRTYNPTPVTRKAFVQTKTTAVRHGILGYESVGAPVVLFVGNVPVNEKDRLTLPDGTQPPIVAVNGVADPAGGTYYTEVECGRPERGNLL